MGERKMAALCACAYVLNRESAKSFKNDVDLESRLRTTFLQEKFILLHEIYHWKFSQFSPEKKELLILEKRLEILKQEKKYLLKLMERKIFMERNIFFVKVIIWIYQNQRKREM